MFDGDRDIGFRLENGVLVKEEYSNEQRKAFEETFDEIIKAQIQLAGSHA